MYRIQYLHSILFQITIANYLLNNISYFITIDGSDGALVIISNLLLAERIRNLEKIVCQRLIVAQNLIRVSPTSHERLVYPKSWKLIT